ncbi:hypothetical protein E2562_008610 [Oryza meyeriana var. granulata]|uniref:Uncharacterized protein n=1 Tax=Oryza meyeriana var. granulata TaxID=110450 RepID=A0A6G1C551_9ORYZ|nr:hypothetical protein E2562_008610 [Oryza meyeriana var. granulata]
MKPNMIQTSVEAAKKKKHNPLIDWGTLMAYKLDRSANTKDYVYNAFLKLEKTSTVTNIDGSELLAHVIVAVQQQLAGFLPEKCSNLDGLYHDPESVDLRIHAPSLLEAAKCKDPSHTTVNVGHTVETRPPSHKLDCLVKAAGQYGQSHDPDNRRTIRCISGAPRVRTDRPDRLHSQPIRVIRTGYPDHPRVRWPGLSADMIRIVRAINWPKGLD